MSSVDEFSLVILDEVVGRVIIFGCLVLSLE